MIGMSLIAIAVAKKAQLKLAANECGIRGWLISLPVTRDNP